MSSVMSTYASIIIIAFFAITQSAFLLAEASPSDSSHHFREMSSTKLPCDFSTSGFNVTLAPNSEYVQTIFWIDNPGTMADCRMPMGTRFVVSVSVMLAKAVTARGPAARLAIEFRNVDFEASSLIFISEETNGTDHSSNFPSGTTIRPDEETMDASLNITVTGCFFDGREETVAGKSVLVGSVTYPLDRMWRITQLLLSGKTYPLLTNIVVQGNTFTMDGSNHSYAVITNEQVFSLPLQLTTYEALTNHNIRFGALAFGLGRADEDFLNASYELIWPQLAPANASFVIVTNNISVRLRILTYTTFDDVTLNLPLPFASISAFALNRVWFASNFMKVLIARNNITAISIRLNATTLQPTISLPGDGSFELSTSAMVLFGIILNHGVELQVVNNSIAAYSHNPYGGALYGVNFYGSLWLAIRTHVTFIGNTIQVNATVSSPRDTAALYNDIDYLAGGISFYNIISNNSLTVGLVQVAVTQWPMAASAISNDGLPSGGNVTRLYFSNTMNIVVEISQIILDKTAVGYFLFRTQGSIFMVAAIRLYSTISIGNGTLAVLSNTADISVQIVAPGGPAVTMAPVSQVKWSSNPLVVTFLFTDNQQLVMNYTKHVHMGNEVNVTLRLLDAPPSWSSNPTPGTYAAMPPAYMVNFLVMSKMVTLLNAFSEDFDTGYDIAYIIDRNKINVDVVSDVTRIVETGRGGMQPNQTLMLSLFSVDRAKIGTISTNSVLALGCIAVNQTTDYPYLGLSNLLTFGNHATFVRTNIESILSRFPMCGNIGQFVVNNAAANPSPALQPFNTTAAVLQSAYENDVQSLSYIYARGLEGKVIMTGNTVRVTMLNTNASRRLYSSRQLPQSVTSLSAAEAAFMSQDIASQLPSFPSSVVIFTTNATSISSRQMGTIGIIGNTIEVTRAALTKRLSGEHVLVPVAWCGYAPTSTTIPPLSISVYRNRFPDMFSTERGFDMYTMGYVGIRENIVTLVDAVSIMSVTTTPMATGVSTTTTTSAPLPSPASLYPLLIFVSLVDVQNSGISSGKDTTPESYGLIEFEFNTVVVPLIKDGTGNQPLTIGGSAPFPTSAIAFTPTGAAPLPASLAMVHYLAWRTSSALPVVGVYLTISFCSNIINKRYLHVTELTTFPLSPSLLGSARVGLGGSGGLFGAMRLGLLNPSLISASSSTNIAVVGCPLPLIPTPNLPITKGTEVIVGSVGVVAVASGQVSAMNAMLRLAKCESEAPSGGSVSDTLDDGLTDDGSMGMSAHPLRFTIGSDSYGIYRGAVIGNTIVFPIIIALIVRFVLGPIVSFWATQDRSIETALRTVGWPSAVVLPYVSLAEGTGKAVSTLYRSGTADGVVIAALGTLLVLSVVGLWVFILIFHLPAKMIRLDRTLFVGRYGRKGLAEGEDFESRALRYKVPCMGPVTKDGAKQRLLSPRWWFTPIMEWSPIVLVGHVSIGFRGMGRGRRARSNGTTPSTNSTNNSTTTPSPPDNVRQVSTSSAIDTYLDAKEANLVAPELQTDRDPAADPMASNPVDPLLYNDSTSGSGTSSSVKSSVTGSDLSLDITGRLTKTNIEYHIESFAHIIGDRKVLVTELMVFICTFGVGVIEGLPSRWCRSRVVLAFIAILIQIMCDIVNLIPIVWVTQMVMNIAVFSLSVVAITQVFQGGEATDDTENALDELGTMGNVIGMFSIFLSLGLTLFRARRMYTRSVMEMRGNDNHMPNNSFIGGVDMADLPTRATVSEYEPPAPLPPPVPTASTPGVEEDLILDSSDESVNSDFDGIDLDALIDERRDEAEADPYQGVIRLNSSKPVTPVVREEVSFANRVLSNLSRVESAFELDL